MTITVQLVLAFLTRHVTALLVLAVLYLWHRIDRLKARTRSDLLYLNSRIDQLEAELPDDEWDDKELLDSEERQWEGYEALAAGDARRAPEKANCARCGQEHAVSDRYPGGVCRNCWRAEMAV